MFLKISSKEAVSLAKHADWTLTGVQLCPKVKNLQTPLKHVLFVSFVPTEIYKDIFWKLSRPSS